jgi:hypothetical protein
MGTRAMTGPARHSLGGRRRGHSSIRRQSRRSGTSIRQGLKLDPATRPARIAKARLQAQLDRRLAQPLLPALRPVSTDRLTDRGAFGLGHRRVHRPRPALAPTALRPPIRCVLEDGGRMATRFRYRARFLTAARNSLAMHSGTVVNCIESKIALNRELH